MIKFNYRARDGTLVIEKEVRPTFGKAVNGFLTDWRKEMKEPLEISDRGAKIINQLLGKPIILSDRELARLIGQHNINKGFIAQRKRILTFGNEETRERFRASLSHCRQLMIPMAEIIEIDFASSKEIWQMDEVRVVSYICGCCGYEEKLGSPQLWKIFKNHETYFKVYFND